MISLTNFPPVIKSLKNSPDVNCIILYGGLGRKDKETQDGDFLVFTKDKNYITPLSPFESLLKYDIDPIETDVYIHSYEEPHRILCRLHKPSSYDHVVNNGKIIFNRNNGKDPIETLKSRKDIWYKVSEKIGVPTHCLLELSEELSGIRTGYMWIRMLIPERKQMKGNVEKGFKKTLNKIRATGIMREGLAIENVFLGKSDEGKNIVNKFFDLHPKIEDYRGTALEIRGFDPKEHRKYSDEDLVRIVNNAKEVGEVSVHDIDEKLCENFEMSL